jgi:hypothetical protein
MVLEDVQKYQEQLKDSCCVLHSEATLVQLVETIKPSPQNEKAVRHAQL